MNRFQTAFLMIPALIATELRADDAEKATIAAIEKIGGKAKVDDSLEEGSKVAVTLAMPTDANLVTVGKQLNVGALTIDNASRITDKGFEALKELTNLQRLVLSKSNFDDKAVIVIGSIRTLQILYLGEAKVTDAGVVGFAKMKHLKVLDLFNTKLTDKGVGYLTGLQKLEELNLSGTKVSDASVPALSKMESLKLLKLVRTDVTRDGVTKLEKELKNATVRW